MNIIRRGLLVIITPFFTLLLFAAAFDWGVVSTVGHPASVKQIASESGVYDSLIPSLLTKVKQVETNVGNLAATDPVVVKAANQAFPSSYIQKNAEVIIDSVYGWLDGKTAQPNFNVDLSGPKAAFADSLATQFEKKAADLPKCVTPYTAASFDISSATCLPAGVTAASVSQVIRDNVSGGKGFIDNSTISASSLNDTNSNRTIFQGQLKNAPTQYQRIKKTPLILILLTLLTAATIFFLSPSHLKGLRHLGITLVIAGLFMLLFSWGLNKEVGSQLVPKITIKDNAVLTDKVRTLVGDVAHRIDKNYWAFGGIYTALGVTAIAAPVIIRRRAPEHSQPLTADTDSTPLPAEPPKTEVKPKKTTKAQ